MTGHTYNVAFTPPGTDERGAPEGMDLINSFLSEAVREDGYAYVAIGPKTRANLLALRTAIATPPAEVTEAMAKAAAREFSAQMGEPLIEDVWAAEDIADWTHIITAALAARTP